MANNNLTRIKNNQITDSTITYAKIASGTLVGSNFNTNLTLNSNVTIVGNLSVSGNSSTLNSVNTFISDPIVLFNDGYSGSISNYNIGMLINRNYASLGAYGAVQTAWVWVEADQAFEGIATTTTGNAFTTLTNSGFANLKVGNVTANSLTITTGTIVASAGIQNTPIGSATASTGAFTSLSSSSQATLATAVATNFSTGNAQITGGTLSGITAGNFTTLQGTNLSSGNAVITGGSVNGSPIGASSASTGAFTTLTASGTAIVSGNVVAASGTASQSTTQGALVVTGGVGISGSAFIGSILNAAGAATLQSTLAVTGVSTLNGNVVAASGTASTNTTTGALVVAGGVGISGALNVAGGLTTSANGAVNGGGLTTSSTTAYLFNETATTVNAFGAATTLNTGNAGSTTNMAGIVKVSGNLVATSGTASTTTGTGALVIAGGAGISGALNVGGTSSHTGAATFASTVIASGNVVAASGTASTSTTTGALVVVGGAGISGNTYIGGSIVITGNLTVNGTTTQVNSTTTTVEDPIFELNTGVNGAALTGSTPFDAGIKTHYWTGSADASAFFGRTNDTGNFEYYAVATESGNVISGTYGTIKSGALTLANTTAATSVTSGALIVSGGVGITGDLYAYKLNATHGNITTGYFGSLNTANAQATGGTLSGMTAGNFTTLQGTNFSSGNAVITGGSADSTPIGATTASTGRFTTLVTTGATWHAGNLVANSTTASTSTTTGALVVVGGIGASGNLNLGTNASLHNIKGNLLLGQGNVVDSADTILTINLNTDTPLVSNAVVHLSGLSGSSSFYGTDAFGTTALAGFAGRKARGTSSAPSAAQANDTLSIFTGKGYGATGYAAGDATGMFVQADQNFTDSAQGTRINFQTVPTGSTAVRQVFQLSANGSAIIPATTTTTSTTSGALIVAGGVGIGGSVYTTGFANIGTSVTVGSTLTVTGVSTLNGNVVAASGTESSSATTGALVVSNSGGLGVTGNVYAAKATIFNSTKTTGMDHIVKGANDETLIWARPNTTYDQVIIGNSATASTAIRGAKLVINSTDSMLLPTGTNAQRPSSTGGTDTQGMLRYNTTSNGMEIYTGTAWQSFTTSFTVIADQQFQGDGSTVAFTLSTAQTTASCIVSINGVVQIPTGTYGTAYSVSSTTLTFTEAPAAGDVIDVRCLTTTVTVNNLTSTNGFMIFSADNGGANVYTGAASPTLTTSWNVAGAQVGFLPNVSVASANTATTIDTVDNTQYRSAKYLVQVTNGASYQVSEALVISNGTTATITTYGTIGTNGNLGVLQATQSGTNTLVQFIATNATNNVRITKDYLAV